VQTLLRVAAMVLAASATATAILGWSALQRSKGARVALSVLAVPLFLVPLLVAGLIRLDIVPAMVCAAIAMLWFQPARDWFEGRAPKPAPERPVRPSAYGAPSASLRDLPPPTGAPLRPAPRTTAQPPWASPSLADLPPPSTPPLGAWPPAITRPAAVRVACTVTWAMTSLALVLFSMTLLVVLAEPDALISEMRRQDPDLADEVLRDTTRIAVVVAVLLAWSAAGLLFAVLAWRRVPWAAIALIVSAALAGLLCLALLAGSVTLVVPMAGCVAVLSLMLRREARQWYAAPRD
jgi:hypothetical protein